jgi:DNA-binding LacI/PurR family transcriptional regulator
MTSYLVEQGRRRIAMITGPMDTPGGTQRLEGFADVLGRKASKKLIAHGDWSRASGERAMTELLERSPDLDAVFVASDLMAAGALAALRAAGRRVPDDVAVGGFDDSSVAVSTHPPLTTIRQPLARVAEETVSLLLALIDGAAGVEPVILPTELVIRESA